MLERDSQLPARAPQSRRTLAFGSVMHVWSDLFFALLIPLLPLIKSDKDLDLTYTQVGVLRSVFTGASAVLQVPAGFMAEHFGEFWLLIGGNMWVAGGLLAMAMMPAFLLLIVASFFGGLGGGTQHPLASSMVSRAYDDRGRSTAVGTVNFAGDLGKMAAPAVGGILGARFGWRTTLRSVGAAGVVFMVLSVFSRRSVDIGKPDASKAPIDIETRGGAPMGSFVALSVVGFLDSMARGGALVFLPFVLEDKGMGLAQTSAMLFLLFAGGAAGKYLCGWLGERWSAVALIWWTKGIAAVLLGLIIVSPAYAMAPLFVALGIGLNGTSSVLYATVADLVPSHRRARLYGVFYTTNEGGTFLSPLLYGRIADIFKLRTAMLAMALGTALILPVSLMLRKYLTPGESSARAETA